jgi:hypothetical protein
MANGRAWSKKEDQVILQGLGTYGYKWIQSKVQDRTKKAILTRAHKLYKAGITRGAYTLNRFAKESGYARTHLVRARDALKQKWQRTGPGGSFLITDDQRGEILDWLVHDYWSKAKRRYCCSWCTSEKRESYALGLCRRCYDKHRKECKQRGLPTTLTAQGEIVGQLNVDGDLIGIHAKVLEGMKRRIKKGLALSRPQLEWLELLKP